MTAEEKSLTKLPPIEKSLEILDDWIDEIEKSGETSAEWIAEIENSGEISDEWIAALEEDISLKKAERLAAKERSRKICEWLVAKDNFGATLIPPRKESSGVIPDWTPLRKERSVEFAKWIASRKDRSRKKAEYLAAKEKSEKSQGSED